MKKILLASTALLAFGAVSAQAAEPIKLSVGGFMKQQLIYADNKDVYNAVKFDEMGFGQVNFTGSTKLDNGISVAVQVETLATQWNDSRNASGARNAATGARAYGNSDVRRAYMTVSSAFGQAVLGQREDYGVITGVGAPDVGWGLQDGDWGNVMSLPTGYAANWTANNSRYNSRTDKLTLITPTFAGFSAGFSYTPDIKQSWTGDLTQGSASDNVAATGNIGTNALINRSDFAGDMYLAGVSYANKLGPVGVKANFDFGQYNMANMRTYQAGLQTSYAGFTLGGSMFAREIGSDDHASIAGTMYNHSASNAIMHTGLNWEVAASYAIDAYAVSLGYFHDTTKADSSFGTANVAGAASSTQVYALSGKYTMGPGIDWRNSIYYSEFKNNNDTVTAENAENKGVAVITGLQVAF